MARDTKAKGATTYENSRFKPGQSWTYATRIGEESSRAIVLRVDKMAASVIVHVAVTELLIERDGGSRFDRYIDNLPLSEEALNDSVRRLEAERAEWPGFESGYAVWREHFDKGEAGIWNAPVAAVVATIENGANSSISSTAVDVWSLLNAAARLSIFGRHEEEIEIYDEIIRRFWRPRFSGNPG